MHLPWRNVNRSLIVGIDIDVNTIKLVALRRRHATDPVFELISYAHKVATPEFPLIHEAVRYVLQQAGINKKSKIVIALPYGQILTKTLEFDIASNSVELENNIIAHCEKMITYPIHEACLDFEILDKGLLSNVRVVIARRSVVEEKVNLFSASEFTIAAVDIESDALARCVYYVLSQENEACRDAIIIVMHIASQKILGLVLYKKSILFVQEIVISVTDPGGIKSDDHLEKIKILFPILELAANNFIRAGYKFSCIADNVFVSGSQFTSDKFRFRVDQIIKRPSRLINPFLNMNKNESININSLEECAQDLVISCGLAMRDFGNAY